MSDTALQRIAPWEDIGRTTLAGPWQLEDAQRYCADMASSHYENFPVVSALFRREQRLALNAIYAFARTADDFADEAAFASVRAELLDGWERQLQAAFEGEAEHPVFIALAPAIERFGLSSEPFQALLDAFRQDVRVRRYDTFDDVRDYCRRSADPVGRLVLALLGVSDPALIEMSDCICTALQLANFWQDVSVDLDKDRIYLPREDLERFGVDEEQLFEQRRDDALDRLIDFQVERTAALFRYGRPLVRAVGYPGTVYLAAVYLGGTTILDAVRRARGEVVRQRPVVSAGSIARRLWSAVRG